MLFECGLNLTKRKVTILLHKQLAFLDRVVDSVLCGYGILSRNICLGEKVGRIEQERLRKLEDKVRGEKADRRTDR